MRPKVMTVTAVLASLIPILWESGIGSDVMKPIAAPIVGGVVSYTIHVLILVPVFLALMKERALRRGTLTPGPHSDAEWPNTRSFLRQCQNAQGYLLQSCVVAEGSGPNFASVV